MGGDLTILTDNEKHLNAEKIRDFKYEMKVSHFARLFQILTDVKIIRNF